ncbi:MAG TPA: hypothetical protein DD666_17230 [Advenella kashmirensis]|uniref:Uncharacterized protein n=1 Tax=Advenella kashmirensis TaxID=310575 RepID=A0A356LK92_9BURK|nr:hypothetical protein [Advenella kashmirensis]
MWKQCRQRVPATIAWQMLRCLEGKVWASSVLYFADSGGSGTAGIIAPIARKMQGAIQKLHFWCIPILRCRCLRLK